MNKVMTIGFAAVMAAGIAGAQSDMSVTGLPPAANASEPEVTAEVALLSSYVWRGQVYNNDAVVQPQITISHYDFSLNIWGNYDLFGSDCNGISGDFSDIDFTFTYDVPFNLSDMELTVGAIHYTFPNNPAGEATTELFATGVINTFSEMAIPVIPSISLYNDVDEANKGAYILIDVCAPYEVSEYLTATLGMSVGHGNATYNNFYFAAPTKQESAFNDYNIYGTVDYELTDDVTASLSMCYTMLGDSAIEDAAADTYDSKEKFWGGVNIAYDF